MCLRRSRQRLKLYMTSTARMVMTVSDTEDKDRHQPDMECSEDLGLAGIAPLGAWANAVRTMGEMYSAAIASVYAHTRTLPNKPI